MQREVSAVSVKHTKASKAERAAQMAGRASSWMILFCFPALHPWSPFAVPWWVAHRFSFEGYATCRKFPLTFTVRYKEGVS